MVEKAPFRPQATPVSTVGRPRIFQRGPRPVEPARPQAPYQPEPPALPEPLENRTGYQLAQALTMLGANAAKLYPQYVEQQATKDLREGSEAYDTLDDPRMVKSWADAVAEGLVSPNASPWFKRGFTERIARNRAMEMGLRLREEYTNSSIRGSTNPTDIIEWMAEKTDEYLGEIEDPILRRSMQPEVQRIRDELISLHVRNSSTNARKQSYDEFTTAIGLAIDEAVTRARQTGEPIDYEALTARIHAEEELALSEGLPGFKVNEAVADTVARKMREYKRSDLARVANAPRVRSDGTKLPGAGRTRYGEVVQRASERLFDEAVAADNRAYQQWRRAREMRSEQLLTESLSMFLQDPYAPLPAEMEAELLSLDPSSFMTLQGYKNRLQDDAGTVDGVTMANIYREIAKNPTSGTLMRLAWQYNLTDDRVASLADDMETMQRYGSPYRDDMFNDYRRSLKSTVSSWYSGPFGALEDGTPVLEATAELDRRWLEYVRSNPEVMNDPIAKQKWFEQAVKGIVDRRNPNNGEGTNPQNPPAFTPNTSTSPSSGNDNTATSSSNAVNLPDVPVFESMEQLNAAIQATRDKRPNILTKTIKEMGIEGDKAAIAEFIQRQRVLLNRQR